MKLFFENLNIIISMNKQNKNMIERENNTKINDPE